MRNTKVSNMFLLQVCIFRSKSAVSWEYKTYSDVIVALDPSFKFWQLQDLKVGTGDELSYYPSQVPRMSPVMWTT